LCVQHNTHTHTKHTHTHTLSHSRTKQKIKTFALLLFTSIIFLVDFGSPQVAVISSLVV
jgi:hypothetical protein